MARKILLENFTLVQCDEFDLDEILCSPILNWIRRVPAWSYTRYYDKAVFKTDTEVLAAYWDNLDNCWNI